jgi:hypothetical protein
MEIYAVHFVIDLISLEIVDVSMGVANSALAVLSLWNLSKLYI